MNKIVNVYKPIGWTPLEVIHAFRKHYPAYRDEKIGYAGRLDPLAHGVVVLMIGEATKEKDQYLGLKKEYIFEALFGVETDTYDMLGIANAGVHKTIVNKNVNIFVNKHIGTFILPYPPYSSKTVNGKPLFWWAKHKKLSEITLPTRSVEITDFVTLSFSTITKTELQQVIHNRINSVHGDFRQHEIETNWKLFFENAPRTYTKVAFKINCSSGTYVRGIVHALGQSLGTGAMAFDILRTRVGDYTLESSLKLSISTE